MKTMTGLSFSVLAVATLCMLGGAPAHAQIVTQKTIAPKSFPQVPVVPTPLVPTPLVPTPLVPTPNPRLAPTPNLRLVNGEYKLGIYADYTRVGAIVRAVEPGSAADRFGLEPGDIIRSINGIAISNQSSYVQAMNDCGGYVEMWVRNVRDGGTVRVRGSVYPLPGPIFGDPAGRP